MQVLAIYFKHKKSHHGMMANSSNVKVENGAIAVKIPLFLF